MMQAQEIAIRRRGRPAASDPNTVRRMNVDKGLLLAMLLDKFRSLVVEVDQKNHDRLENYQKYFGTFDDAARNLGDVLVKAGVVAKAEYQSSDNAGEIRRATYRFEFDTRAGLVRHNVGTIGFGQLSPHDLWVPLIADIDGVSAPLELLRAAQPLLPYHIDFDNGKPIVTNALND
jgi:hypothetical protein